MRDYKEMADSALSRINEYETKKNKRKKVISQVSVVVGCICVALTVTTAMLKSDIFSNQMQLDDSSQNSEKITVTTEKTTNTTKNAVYYQSTSDTATTKKQTTTHNEITTKKQTTTRSESTAKNTVTGVTGSTEGKTNPSSIPITALTLDDWLSNDYVVWSDTDLKGSIDFATPIEKGGVAMIKELRDALDKYGDTRFYAVMVSFESSLPKDYLKDIMCDGKSVVDLKKEADALLASGKNEEAKRIYVKINEAKRAYLLNYIDNFRDTFYKNGMKIFTESNGTTIDNMIFYCFAPKGSIENFKCKGNEAFYFTLAMRFK